MNRHVHALALGIALITLAACAPSAGTPAQFPPNKGAIPTVTIDDTSPANLDFSLSVNIGQDSLAAKPTLTIGAQFMNNGRIITFVRGEKLICGGNVIPALTGQAYISYTIPAGGSVVNCTYTSPQGQATFSYTNPQRPAIVSLAAGATIARSARTAVTVTIVPTCQNLGIVYGNQASDGSGKGQSVASPTGCTPHQTIDTTTLTAGGGVLGVNEGGQLAAVTNNPGFHTFTLSIYSSFLMAVTWK